jgi:hypothetical protein
LTEENFSGLTPAQEDYFAVLEKMSPSPGLRRAMERAKADLAYRNRRERYEQLAKTEPERRLLRRLRAWLSK